MKIALCSDLHLEFGSIVLHNTEQADVLILSGDILIENDLDVFDQQQYDLGFMRGKSRTYHEFFANVCSEFPHVIYIAGNHEHYHGDYAKTLPGLVEKLAHYSNLHVLDKETFVLGNTTFVGGTLWTDMNKEDPITLSHIRGYMNDYRIIENSAEIVHYKTYHNKMKDVGITDDEWLALPYEERVYVEFRTRPAKFTPEDSVFDHKQMLSAIAKAIADAPADHTIVVVGHHSPSKLSTKPQYEKDVVVNGAYSSELSEFILDNPRIKLWTHGHTHHKFDYMIGDTRIVCNPRGYIGYESQAHDFELMYVDI